MGHQGLPPGAELVAQAVQTLPPYVADDPRGFLLGRGGCVTGEVQALTGTRVSIPGGPNDVTRTMSIEGPLLNCCAAYVLMMRRYVEVEAEMALWQQTHCGSACAGGSSGGGGAAMWGPGAMM